MFTILNRLRGTDSLWSKVIGLLIGFCILIITDNVYVSITVGIGYILGESFGWGEWVGELSTNKTNKAPSVTTEGINNGIFFLANKIISFKYKWTQYCRVALTIRGFYWWILVLAPLYFIGVNLYIIILGLIFLSVGFPLACELGYITSKKFTFSKYGFSMNGGWEHQEVWYGLMQDIVLITIVLSVL